MRLSVCPLCRLLAGEAWRWAPGKSPRPLQVLSRGETTSGDRLWEEKEGEGEKAALLFPDQTWHISAVHLCNLTCLFHFTYV